MKASPKTLFSVLPSQLMLLYHMQPGFLPGCPIHAFRPSCSPGATVPTWFFRPRSTTTTATAATSKSTTAIATGNSSLCGFVFFVGVGVGVGFGPGGGAGGDGGGLGSGGDGGGFGPSGRRGPHLHFGSPGFVTFGDTQMVNGSKIMRVQCAE